MLYDASGRPLPRFRRAIGFLVEYVAIDEPEHTGDLAYAIGSDWAEDNDDIPEELEL